MSSIEKLGKDRSRARWRDPGGRQKAKTFTQKDFADNYLRNIDAAIQTGTYVDPSLGNVKVKDFAVKWMSAQGHLKPSTRATYESILGKHVMPRWGSTPLLTVAQDHVAVWVSWLLISGPSPATARYVHRVFSLLLDIAVRSSRIPRNPATGARLPRVQMAEKRFLSHQEVNALAQAAGDYRVAVLLLSEVQVPKDRAAPGDEDECVGGFAGHGDREVVDQKTRDRRRPGLLRLWSSPDQVAANLADSLGNAQSMPRQIDPADLQRRHVAPA
jgi:hypothetical protein